MLNRTTTSNSPLVDLTVNLLHRIATLILTTSATILSIHPENIAESAEKHSVPNIVLILADDLGYADVGFNGCRDIRTPHIDSVAASGVRFTNAYVSYSGCSPSRAGFITGRYSQRFGYERNLQYRPNDPNMGLPTSETTIADSLESSSCTTSSGRINTSTIVPGGASM